MLSGRKKYIDVLIKNERRDKVRAFLEYQYDVKTNNVQTIRKYAKEWGIGSTTAHDWIVCFLDNGVDL